MGKQKKNTFAEEEVAFWRDGRDLASTRHEACSPHMAPSFAKASEGQAGIQIPAQAKLLTCFREVGVF